MPTGWLGWDWGNVPSWVGSVLTGTSLAIAAGTYARATKDRRRALDDTERSQAARVSMWWVNPTKALVRNGNDVAVVVQAIIPPSAASAQVALAPDETRTLTLRDVRDGESDAVELSIIDSYGRSWIRRGATLERVTTGSSVPTPASEEIHWTDR